jgi:hypothetical protein
MMRLSSAEVHAMATKKLHPVPIAFVDYLKNSEDTGFGYKVVSVELKDGRRFNQVVVSECCIIEVRGHDEVPFLPQEVASIKVNHRQWNFREASDVRKASRVATS